MNASTITDPADPRLDDYRGMRRPAERARRELEGGFFVCEGVIPVRRLLQSQHQVRSVLVEESKLDRIEDLVDERQDLPVYLVDAATIRTVAGFDFHRGVIASGVRPPPTPVRELTGAPSLVVLEGINDHENLGAMFRTAAALGAGGILADPTSADPWYRRSVRVSMGAVLELPFARAEQWPGDLKRLKEAGFLMVALTPDPAAPALGEVALPAGRRVALMVGAEGPGLTAAARAAAHTPARIPMHGGIDSLNVSHALAIALYHYLVLRGDDW